MTTLSVLLLALACVASAWAAGTDKNPAKTKPKDKSGSAAARTVEPAKTVTKDKDKKSEKEKKPETAAPAEPAAGPADYGRAWSGGPDGKECYFVPRAVAAGNYFEWPGEELLVLDEEGFAHVMSWENSGFVTAWVSEKPAVKKAPGKIIAADLNGDGLDETLVLGPAGALAIIGSQKDGFMPLCAGCLADELKGKAVRAMTAADGDGDGADEAVAWMIFDGEPYLVSLGWNGSALEAESAKMVLGADAKVNVKDIFPAPGEKPVNEYYAVIGIGSGRAVSPVKLDEEGALLEGATLLPEEVTGPIFPGGPTAGTVMMSPAVENGAAELLLLGPAPDFKMEKYTGVPGKAAFFTAADLNGDKTKEMEFVDAGCGFEVHAAHVKFKLIVNGKSADAGKSVRRLSGGRVYIAPGLVKGVKVKDGDDFTTVEKSGRRLTFDRGAGIVQLATPDAEESVEVKVGYIKEPGRFLIDAVAAAEQLDFTCDWDFLSQTLRISN